MDAIKEALDANGYDYAVAIATQAEIESGAACGQTCNRLRGIKTIPCSINILHG